MIADIIFYSPCADSAPALSEIKESYRYINNFLSSIGFKPSSGLKACWGKMQFQQFLKDSLLKSRLIVVMDSYESYPNTAKDIICRGIGCKSVYNDKVLFSLEKKLRKQRKDMPENLLHIAQVPQNASVFENPVGIEPALLLTAGKQSILIVPYKTDMIKSLFEHSLSAVCSELAGHFSETVSFNVASKDEKYVLDTVTDILKDKQKNISVSVQPSQYYTTVTLKAVENSLLNAKMLAADSLNMLKKSLGARYFKTNVSTSEHALTARMKAEEKKAVLFSLGENTSLDFKKLSCADSAQSVFKIENDLDEPSLLKLGVKKATIKKYGISDPLTAVEAANKLREKHEADYAICFINGAKQAFICCDDSTASLTKCQDSSSYECLIKIIDKLLDNDKFDDSIELSEALKKKQKFHTLSEKIPDADKKAKMPLSNKIILALASIVFIASAGYIVNYYLGSYLNLKSNEKLLSMLGNGQTAVNYPADFDPRFSSLYAINQDVRGVLNIPGTGVDYPVLQTSDNDYYLRRDFYKNDNRHGSIFLDCNADIRTPGSNIVIYGHNMKDGQMFGELLKYEDINFYKEHPVITFDSVYRPNKYKIISVFLADVSPQGFEQFPYTNPMLSPSPDEMQTFISEIKARSLINTTVDVQNTDRLLTLSTCDYTFDNARFVVVAREIRDGESEDVDTSGCSYNQNPIMPAAMNN